MKVRSILVRSVFVVGALAVVYVSVAATYLHLKRTDAVAAVEEAIDAQLAGQEWTNLSFQDEFDYRQSFDSTEFLADVGTGYELGFAERWLNAYDVEILTGNGKRYVASPMWSTTVYPNDDATSEWWILCCELLDQTEEGLAIPAVD